MTLEEIVTELNAKNSEALNGRDDADHLCQDQVLELMNAAAMQGFRMGSNTAMSMVKGALLVQMTRGTHKGMEDGNSFSIET